MAKKTYQVNDFWLDIDKENHVDIESTDGVIDSVKINGEEAGGGGSSDFSTAEVTIINNKNYSISGKCFACYEENALGPGSPVMLYNMVSIPANERVTLKVPMYKGTAYWARAFDADGTTATTTGDIVNDEGYFSITGNGSITLV